MDEISSNNPNSRRLGLKSPKLNFLPFLVAKNLSRTQIFKYMSRAQFSSDFFFQNARNNVHYQNQKQLKLPKNTNYKKTIP